MFPRNVSNGAGRNGVPERSERAALASGRLHLRISRNAVTPTLRRADFRLRTRADALAREKRQKHYMSSSDDDEPQVPTMRVVNARSGAD